MTTTTDDKRGQITTHFYGWVERHPVMRATGDGTPVVNFWVTAPRQTTRGRVVEERVKLAAFSEMAERCKDLKPGDCVVGFGRQQTNTWHDNNGVDHKAIDVVVVDLNLVKG